MRYQSSSLQRFIDFEGGTVIHLNPFACVLLVVLLAGLGIWLVKRKR